MDRNTNAPRTRARRWGSATAAVTLLLVAGACSSSGDSTAATTITEAPVEQVDAQGRPTTSVGPTTSAAIQQELKDTYGITFDATQGTCLGTAFEAKPALVGALTRNYSPDAPVAQELVGIYTRCLGGMPGAAKAYTQKMVKEGNATEPQAACMEKLVNTFAPEELGKLIAADEQTLMSHQEHFAECSMAGQPTTTTG
jgi:hypothetical protein